MIARDFSTKLKHTIARWKYERSWRRATPATQVAYIIEMLHSSPELRRAFREALFGKTNEVRSTDREHPKRVKARR